MRCWIVRSSSIAGPTAGRSAACFRQPVETRAQRIFAVAGDAPLVTAPLVETLLQARRDGDEAVVPEHDGRLEPLAALYERAALLRKAGSAYTARIALCTACSRAYTRGGSVRSKDVCQRQHRLGPSTRSRRRCELRTIDLGVRSRQERDSRRREFPVRAFKAVGGTPVFMKSGSGADDLRHRRARVRRLRPLVGTAHSRSRASSRG